MALTPRDRRMLQILGVVAGLALAYFVVTSVLGGGDEGDVALPTGPSGIVTPTGSPTASPGPEPSETLPPVVLAGARDPFSTPPELVTTSALPTTGTAVPTGPTGTTTTTTTPRPPTTTTFPTTTTTTFPTTTTTTGTTTSTSTSPGDDDDGNPDEPTHKITIGEHNLRLFTVHQKQQRVEIFVDHKLWTVEEGGTFEEVYKLVKIQGRCARFLYGDDSFTLCPKS